MCVCACVFSGRGRKLHSKQILHIQAMYVKTIYFYNRFVLLLLAIFSHCASQHLRRELQAAALPTSSSCVQLMSDQTCDSVAQR